MMQVVVPTILLFAVAMLGLGAGLLLKRRGLRGPCCTRGPRCLAPPASERRRGHSHPAQRPAVPNHGPGDGPTNQRKD